MIILRLYIAFKGKGNSSNKLVSNLDCDKLFLTNSLSGIKRDIDKIETSYSEIFMFGLDKKLKGTVRIEKCAEIDNILLTSLLDLEKYKENLCKAGLNAEICCSKEKSLCNYAFWYALKKFNLSVAFFHIPSISYIDNTFICKIKSSI